MAQHGWILFLNRPKGWCNLPNNEEKMNVFRSYVEDCFNRVEPLLVNGLHFTLVEKCVGMAYVMGPCEDCSRLKEQIEEMGIGEMYSSNTDCICSAY